MTFDFFNLQRWQALPLLWTVTFFTDAISVDVSYAFAFVDVAADAGNKRHLG